MDIEKLKKKLAESRDHYAILDQSPENPVTMHQWIQVLDSKGNKRIGQVIAIGYPSLNNFIIEFDEIDKQIQKIMEQILMKDIKIIEILTQISDLRFTKHNEKFRLIIEEYGLYFEAESFDIIISKLINFFKDAFEKLNGTIKNSYEKK